MFNNLYTVCIVTSRKITSEEMGHVLDEEMVYFNLSFFVRIFSISNSIS